MLHTKECLISIIIPVYNQARELELALTSIEQQTYRNFEVIVVDDGSSPEFQISNFKFQNIRIVRQPNQGAPAARNRGLEIAKGEYVIFWDADVVAEPVMLEKMKKALDENLNVSFVYCDFNIQYSMFNIQKIMKARQFNIAELKQNNFIHSTSLIRKADAIKWDESLKRFQDWDLWLTMTEHDKVGIYIPETLFTIIAKGQISAWLPRFAYKKPWKYLPYFNKRVKDYERAREIIIKKHS